MERYKESGNRNQMSLLPMCFDDMIDEENPVRAIGAIVVRMDIPSLGFKYAKPPRPVINHIVLLICSSCTPTATLTASAPAEKLNVNVDEILRSCGSSAVLHRISKRLRILQG